jgi:hypothetical protein
MHQLDHPRSWIHPPQGFIKVNVDGSMSNDDQRGVVSAVCRDDAGLLLGSSALVFLDLIEPGTLEALACHKALFLAKDLLIQCLKIASGCKMVVSNNNKGTLGVISTMVKEINETSKEFESCSFVHEGRLSNMKAHHLAKHALH